MISVIVNGALGKMGSLACQAIQTHPDFVLVGALGRQDNLSAAIKNTQAQILVDFTSAECAYANASTIIDHHVHPVKGCHIFPGMEFLTSEGIDIIIFSKTQKIYHYAQLKPYHLTMSQTLDFVSKHQLKAL
jgi:hypothetical protein